jgi:hypothetical protein
MSLLSKVKVLGSRYFSIHMILSGVETKYTFKEVENLWQFFPPNLPVKTTSNKREVNNNIWYIFIFLFVCGTFQASDFE